MALKDWVENLQACEREKQKFTKQGREAYRAIKGTSDTDVDTLPYEYNLFWANVNVLKSALYANPPKPSVKREFDDYMDQPARVAGIMMERILDQDLCAEGSDMHSNISLAIDDRLVCGLGQVWLRYKPTIRKSKMPEQRAQDGTVLAEAQTVEEITSEKVLTDYVYWEDFFWAPARMWVEVWWVARRIYMTKIQVRRKFGAKAAKEVNYGDTRDRRDTSGELTPRDKQNKKAEIFEVWNKRNKTVCFYTRDGEKPLKDVKDPLGIPGFYPCPRPVVANVTNGNYMPKSDYQMVKSQYSRIDMISARLYLLEEAVRVAGVYDKSNNELQQLLNEGSLNKMIPVDNWGMLAEKGGLAGSIDWFPLEQVVGAITVLRTELGEANKQLYELVGISDIMRGTSSPRETLGAQQMKAQYSSARLQYQQKEVGEFVGRILKIKAHIISKHFQPQSIIKASNIMLTPDSEQAAQAVQILKDEWSICYRLSIDSDTMAIPDYNAERAGRIEFITATGQFFSQVMPLVEKEASAAPFFLEILRWGIAGFKSGATIEGVFDRAVKEITKKLQQPPEPPPPDPALVKAQADVKAKQMTTQADVASTKIKTDTDVKASQIKSREDIKQDWAKVNAQIAQINAKTAADKKDD